MGRKRWRAELSLAVFSGAILSATPLQCWSWPLQSSPTATLDDESIPHEDGIAVSAPMPAAQIWVDYMVHTRNLRPNQGAFSLYLYDIHEIMGGQEKNGESPVSLAWLLHQVCNIFKMSSFWFSRCCKITSIFPIGYLIRNQLLKPCSGKVFVKLVLTGSGDIPCLASTPFQPLPDIFGPFASGIEFQVASPVLFGAVQVPGDLQ